MAVAPPSEPSIVMTTTAKDADAPSATRTRPVIGSGVGIAMGVPVDGAGTDRETPMLRACLRGHWLLADTLLELGANARAHGRFGSTALHMVQLPEWLAKSLLERGALLDGRDMLRQTPLMVCCETGNLPVARLLLQWGAAVDARTADGVSVLDIAQATGGDIEQLIREALMLQPALKLASE